MVLYARGNSTCEGCSELKLPQQRLASGVMKDMRHQDGCISHNNHVLMKFTTVNVNALSLGSGEALFPGKELGITFVLAYRHAPSSLEKVQRCIEDGRSLQAGFVDCGPTWIYLRVSPRACFRQVCLTRMNALCWW